MSKNKYFVSDRNGYGEEECFKMSEALEAVDFESFCLRVEYKKSGKTPTVSFSLTDFTHCCGMKEVGNLSDEVLTDIGMDMLFKKFFEEIEDRSVIITTIKEQAEWEGYLSRTPLFSAVKTFENPGSGNNITLWVSTN